MFVNLCKGLDRLGADYVTNIPFEEILPGDLVGVIGRGSNCLDGYRRSNPILAGVAVGDHPTDWPTLFDDHPVAAYVVHSEWVRDMYERHYGSRVVTWAVGIDTEAWVPIENGVKNVDFLVYDKVRWDHDRVHRALVDPLVEELRKRGLSYRFITYGKHKPIEYRAALAEARAMLFLCEHETQGLAYQEAMSCDIPILAWDPGQWLDPWRFRYSEGFVPATSVPFFDHRCGMSFVHLSDFGRALSGFMNLLDSNAFKPREYVLETLTLEGCARRYLDLLVEHCG